jgi:alkylhydroperoxidase family enzyme
LGVSEEKLLAVVMQPLPPEVFTEEEALALGYADRITLSDQDVDDEFFRNLRERFSEDQIVELTEVIAWENASTKFNRALRIPSQQLWKRQTETMRRDGVDDGSET